MFERGEFVSIRYRYTSKVFLGILLSDDSGVFPETFEVLMESGHVTKIDEIEAEFKKL